MDHPSTSSGRTGGRSRRTGGETRANGRESSSPFVVSLSNHLVRWKRSSSPFVVSLSNHLVRWKRSSSLFVVSLSNHLVRWEHSSTVRGKLVDPPGQVGTLLLTIRGELVDPFDWISLPDRRGHQPSLGSTSLARRSACSSKSYSGFTMSISMPSATTLANSSMHSSSEPKTATLIFSGSPL